MNCNKFETKIFYEIKKHSLRKRPCNKRSEIILLSDDQLLVMSLLPYHNEVHTIDIKELDYLSNSNIISKNKIELYNEIDIIEKNKEKKCKYCFENFNLISELKKHIISKCFYEDLCKRKTIDENSKK